MEKLNNHKTKRKKGKKKIKNIKLSPHASSYPAFQALKKAREPIKGKPECAD